VEDGVLPHVNNDDIEEERRVAYVGITRAKRILGLTYADVRYGQAAAPSPFLRELTGKSPSVCIWTGPRAEAADERLPLLSDRERQRINEEASSQRHPARSASGRARVHGADAAEGGERRSRKKKNGLPARHGRPWGAEDDHRLRTQFLRGEAIAAMAHAHQRKKGAIRSRLVKLGLLIEGMSTQSDRSSIRQD
jgi:hypothetical protein